MAITSKTILFCWQRADVVNVKVELDVELEGDNNLNLVENIANRLSMTYLITLATTPMKKSMIMNNLVTTLLIKIT